MKRIHIKKPDIRGFFTKVRNLKKEDIKRHFKEKKERRQHILEQRRNSRFAKKMQPVYKWMNRLSLPLQFLLACVVNFLIEVISRLSFFEAWDYLVGTPLVFLYNAFMIFATFSIVYLVRRRVFARILISVFWIFLGICNGYLLTKRVTPFNAQDLKVLSDALELTGNYFNTFELVMIIIGVVALVFWVVSMWRRGGQFQGKMHRIIALGGVAVSFGACLVLTNVAIDKRVISNYFGNIAFAYEDYGFPYCFSASLFNTGINKPAGYSEQTMDEISDHGELTKNETGRSAEELPNIMFVQLESFFDPTEVEWLRFSEDPIPNLRKLFSEYSSGYFKVPSVGAGTANTEFECITGMNLRYFGPGEYPYKTILKETTCESAAYDLREAGYATHAIHNNKATFYSRADVFKNLGFETYTSKEYMDVSNTTENGWLKDEVLIGHILDCLESTARRDFIYTISVQGHGEYPTEQVLEDPAIQVTGAETEEKNYQWEYYVNQLHEMDQFIVDLIDALDAYGEDYVLVMYGDHLPTLGLTVEDVSNRYLFDTSYVIVDNIGLEKEDDTLCSYQIAAEVLDRVDIHTGIMMQYHQARRKTKWYLPDMELLQYDLLYGERYAYDMDGETPYETLDMQMGIRQPEIRNVVALEEMTYVFGQNFTTATKVYVDGEYQSTKYMNDHVLQLKKTVLTEDALIAVKQLAPGKARRVLSEGNTYSFHYEERGAEEPDTDGQNTDVQSTDGENTDVQEGTGETA